MTAVNFPNVHRRVRLESIEGQQGLLGVRVLADSEQLECSENLSVLYGDPEAHRRSPTGDLSE